VAESESQAVVDIEVVRDDLRRVRAFRSDRSPLAEGEARVLVEGFAFTTNNITYAVFGDALHYWDFFPAGPDDGQSAADATPWGRIPVWGFGQVSESRSDDLTVGERLYGYFPMSSEVVLTPGRADERGITDLAAHRQAMAGAYNRYLRVSTDPVHRTDREDHQMLLFPLFFTSFLVDDFFVDNGWFGAGQLVVSSASSKTAIGVAYLAHARGGIEVVGLTSPGNVSFVETLGVYDRVVTYDDVAEVSVVPSVFVDIAGNRDVLHAVHTHLGDQLAHSMTVGGTHWDHEATAPAELPGPAPAFFFAPGQIAKRTQDWGRDGLDARMGEAWRPYADWADGWVEFDRATGSDAVEQVYLELLDGRVDPRAGHICSLDPD